MMKGGYKVAVKCWKENYPVLAKAADESGYKIAHIAKSAGLTYRQLWGRLTNEIDFEDWMNNE